MGLLGACAQTPAPVADCVSLAAAGQLRVTLSFRQPVEGASAPLLQALQQRSGACVAHLSSVSDTVHSYTFAGVGDRGALRQNLLSWSLVRDVVFDQKASPRLVP